MSYNFTKLTDLEEVQEFPEDGKVLIIDNEDVKQIDSNLIQNNLSDYLSKNLINQPNGIVGLDENRKINKEQLPEKIYVIIAENESTGEGTIVSEDMNELNSVLEDYIQSHQVTMDFLTAISKISFWDLNHYQYSQHLKAQLNIYSIQLSNNSLVLRLSDGMIAYFNIDNGWVCQGEVG